MVHIKLIKSRSYNGIVSATAQKPDLFVDSEVAAEAVATGFFEKVGEIADKQDTQEELADLKEELLPALPPESVNEESEGEEADAEAPSEIVPEESEDDETETSAEVAAEAATSESKKRRSKTKEEK